MNEALKGRSRSDWETPQDFFDRLDAEFGFTLDPCATEASAKCERFFTEAEDGLAQSWAGETVFVNPPYGHATAKWVRKAYESARDDGATVVCLIPASTETGYWHEYCMAGEVRLLRGRLYFTDGDGRRGRAPFASAVIVFRPEDLREGKRHPISVMDAN